MNILQRKPWKAPHGPCNAWRPWRELYASDLPVGIAIQLYVWVQGHNLAQWLRNAHDCQDPRIGCSCAGSYRFPDNYYSTRS